MATNTEPAWYQNMVKANAVASSGDVLTAPGGPYQIRNDTPSNITMLAGNAEMIKVGPDGFWVRGVKVEQDADEAKKVYEGFKAWMMWAQLTRDYK